MTHTSIATASRGRSAQARDGIGAPVLGLAAVAAFWALAYVLFGYAGLIVPALALVAMLFVLLVVITAGR